MMRPARLATLVVSAMLGFSSLSAAQAATFSPPPAVKGTSLAEPVACRTVRERVVRPNGSVVYRVKRNCGLAQAPHRRHCTMVKERIHRANGSVVFRSVRRCN
jgi:hypothetical protein